MKKSRYELAREADKDKDSCAICGCVEGQDAQDIVCGTPGVVLIPCVKCGKRVCKECSSKSKKCATCSVFDLPAKFHVGVGWGYGNSSAYRLERPSPSQSGGTLEEAAQPLTFWYDSHPRCVEIKVAIFYGVGHHLFTDIDEIEDAILHKEEGKWYRPNRFNEDVRKLLSTRDPLRSANKRCVSQKQSEAFIRSTLNKWYKAKKYTTVNVFFGGLFGGNVDAHKWFYKDGD